MEMTGANGYGSRISPAMIVEQLILNCGSTSHRFHEASYTNTNNAKMARGSKWLLRNPDGDARRCPMFLRSALQSFWVGVDALVRMMLYWSVVLLRDE